MNELALVVLVALDGFVGAGINNGIERFGGSPAAVQAVFVKSPGQDPVIEAALYLDGGDLLAPINTPTPFVPESGQDPRLYSGRFNIPIPEVKKPTVFHIFLSARTDGEKSIPCGDFRITAFPPDFFEQSLKSQPAFPEVGIAGTFPGLRELLEKNHLRYREVSMKTPDSLPPGSVVVADLSNETIRPSALPETKKLLFGTGIDSAKFVEGKATSFLVTQPIPNNFEESPSAQRLLLELLK